MTAEAQIILVTTEHVAAVADLFNQYRVWYGEASDPDGARNFLFHRLANNESVVFLAQVDLRPAGFVQLYPLFSSISMEPVWLLNDLFVTASARSQGIGSLLLQAATEFARQSGALRLELATAVHNLQAQSFYVAHGWEQEPSFLHFTRSLID